MVFHLNLPPPKAWHLGRSEPLLAPSRSSPHQGPSLEFFSLIVFCTLIFGPSDFGRGVLPRSSSFLEVVSGGLPFFEVSVLSEPPFF